MALRHKNAEYLGNEEQGECHGDGHVGVREGEQQHPIRMERGEGEPDGDRNHVLIVFCVCPMECTRTLLLHRFRHVGHARCLPEQVEHGGEKQLVVDGDAHVARFMEGGGDRPDSGPQGASPAQEQKLSCSRRKKEQSKLLIVYKVMDENSRSLQFVFVQILSF